MSYDPYVAFERDIAEHLREDAIQAMAEATGGYGSAANVHILERDQIDAINYRAAGIIEIEGREYTFQFEDGNWNGSVLLSWESEQPFEYHVPMRWALQPTRDLIDRAITGGNGPFLLLKWAAMLKRAEIAAIPGKYSYDRHFQPGAKVETYWKAKAAEYRFDIVSEDEAIATRAALAKALPPASSGATSRSVDAPGEATGDVL